MNPTNQIVTRPLATDENPDFSPKKKKNTPSVVSLKKVKKTVPQRTREYFFERRGDKSIFSRLILRYTAYLYTRVNLKQSSS